jgi:hypothetical protein
VDDSFQDNSSTMTDLDATLDNSNVGSPFGDATDLAL